MIACILLDTDDKNYMGGRKNIKINNIVGCVLYCKTLDDDVGGLGGGCGGCGGSSYFYLLGIDKSDKGIIDSLVDDNSSSLFVSFNNNKMNKVIVKKGA